MDLKLGWSRRSFLSLLGAMSGGALVPRSMAAEGAWGHTKAKGSEISVDGRPIVPIKSGLGSTDIYAELGVTPIVNINGTVTVIGGSVMDPEVMEVIRQGNVHHVSIDDLEVAAGKWIAKLCKLPEGYTALVTGGAAAALLVSYAGMMTEDIEWRLHAVPDATGFPRNEVIIQKGHIDNFTHQIWQTGAKMVVVETREQMIGAINPKTVCIHFLNIQSNRGQISAAETIEIAKAHNIYTYCDAAADVPPVERLWTYPGMGFDMVDFSGGKDIRGPQSTGLLIGKENLIHYALMNMSPQEDRIGRPCKVGKEVLFGFLKALEIFVNQDYDATLEMYDARARTISNAIAKYGVTALPRQYNPNALGNVTPRYSWRIDPAKLKITGEEVMEQLADTRPIAIGARNAGAAGARGRSVPYEPPADAAGGPQVPHGQPGNGRRHVDPQTFGFTVWQIKPGEDQYIADRLAQIFSNAQKA